MPLTLLPAPLDSKSYLHLCSRNPQNCINSELTNKVVDWVKNILWSQIKKINTVKSHKYLDITALNLTTSITLEFRLSYYYT